MKSGANTMTICVSLAVNWPRRGFLRAIMFMAVLYIIAACAFVRLTPEEEFRILFAGYTLTRTGAIAKNESLSDGGLGNLRDPVSLVGALTPGDAFAFRKETEWPNERVALEILPGRLKAMGMRIVRRPESVKDLLYAVAGGPFFRIDFTRGERTGTIFNRLARDETEGPPGSEVLVVIYR
jgi:hypothetical protein